MLSRAILSGGVWNGFLLGRAKKDDVPCRFCGGRDGDGHFFFWECTFPPLQHVRDLPEFATLMRRDRSRWPRCLPWHGWLPGLGHEGQRDCWAASLGQLAERRLESALGGYPADHAGCWVAPDFFGMRRTLLWRWLINIWTDGNRVDYPTGGFEVAGSGVFFQAPEATMLGAVWGATEEYGEALDDKCRVFMSVPGTLQSVQRVEFWGAILALQAYYPCHLGIDNLNVARIIGRLLDRGALATPLPLVKDGDLVAIVQHMLTAGGPDTVKVTKVEGHATEIDIEQGRVRAEEKFGNDEAHDAADLGRRSQTERLIDARRALFCVRDIWYPIVSQLHRFMVAISRVSVNHDGRGGTAPDALVWDQGCLKKRQDSG